MNSSHYFTPRRLLGTIAILLIVLILSFVLSLLVGPTRIDFSELFSGEMDEFARTKLFKLRMPKAWAAMVVGGSLAVAGAVFQALLRNPLASPYILGISAAGSLGAVLALFIGVTHLLVPGAFCFSLLGIAIVLIAARRQGRMDPTTLLLTGVVVNAFFSACILFLTLTAEQSRTQHVLHWLVGGLREANSTSLLLYGTLGVLTLTGVLFVMGRGLNILTHGEKSAQGMGLDIGKLRLQAFLLASLLTAIAVSIAGPIGFVGLMVPHLLRRLVGHDYRILVPACALGGAAFLLCAEVAASAVWSQPLPVGILSAFLGAPFFLLVMRRNLGKTGLRHD